METTDEYRRIATALRKVLKNRGVTYEALAEKLGISSRTVKRIIHGDDYSVTKLAEVCGAIGIKFFDLMQLAQEEEEESFELSQEQEEFLAASPKHFLFFNLLRKKILDEIRREYGLSVRDARSYAKDLEGIGLLERYPGDQVKLTVKGSSHQFIEDGPLDKVIGRRDMMRFAEKLYDRGPGSTTFITSSGSRISKKTMDELIKDMEDLSTRYRLISQRERSLLPESELLEVRWAMAVVHPFQSWINELKL